jgi:beta-N-acetylhexosaminidase
MKLKSFSSLSRLLNLFRQLLSMRRFSCAEWLVYTAFLVLALSCQTVKPEVLLPEMPPVETTSPAQMPEKTLRERASVLAAAMNDSELAGQVIMTAVDGKGRLYDASRNRLRTVKPGAVLLFKANVDSPKSDIAALNAEIVEYASLAVGAEADPVMLSPLIAVDHEGGLVHRFGAGVEHLPAPLAYWNDVSKGTDNVLRKIEEDAFRSGQEIAELGFTMNLAPVVEILDETNREFLATRAYGSDRDFVVQAAAAFIRGMRRAGVLCVIKHFPGNSNLDPHQTLPVLSISGKALDDYSAPFSSVIGIAEPSGLMVSHVIVKEWDAEHNASLSPTVIQKQIRENLQFTRIIITDDLAMGAVASLKIEEASVSAIAAGADMVITWPATLLDVHAALLAALKNGRIPRSRLVEAATNIITEKLRLRTE